MRLTADVAKSLVRLGTDRDFQAFIEHIRKAREDALRGLQQANELLQIGRLQGEAGTLGELLEAVDKAADVADSQERRPGPWMGHRIGG